MFQLLQPTAALLKSVTNRVEKHGDEDVPAISLAFKITVANFILDALSPKLRHTLYERPPGAADDLPGIEPSTPLLRFNAFESVSLKACFEGWTLHVEHGIDEEPMSFGACKVDAFRVVPMEGGSVELYFRVGTSAIEPEEAGVLWAKNRQEVTITLIAPEKKPDAIDGSVETFERETHEADATALFAGIED